MSPQNRPPERLRFARVEPGPAVERMTTLTDQQHGWANFEPEVPDDTEVPEDGVFGFFSARGRTVPLCTWVVENVRRGRRRPASLGIQHPTGTKTANRLADLGRPVPPGWRVTQDHPRRGLVVDVVPEETVEVVLAWLLDAGAALCPLPLTGWWNAAVYAERA